MEPSNQLLPTDTARPNGALGPAYLVGALRAAGIEADYYDGTVGNERDGVEDCFHRRYLQDNKLIRYGVHEIQLAAVIMEYDVLALSSIFTAQTRMHFESIRIARLVRPNIRIIVGGVNARALRKQFLDAGADYVCMGDGEQEVVAFALDHAMLPPPYRNLDEIPFPALDALPLDTYQKLGIPHAGVMPKGTRFGAIQTSRGCQDACTFCHISTEKQDGMGYLRAFSVDRVRQDVDNAVDLGITRLYFEDDNLFYNKKRLYSLHPALKRTGLEYSNVNGGNLRFLFTSAGDVDREFIDMMRDFGLVELTMPFESRSSRIMKQYATNKYSADEYDSQALVRYLKDTGIRIAGNFMIGFPDEPWESVLATKHYARQLLDAGLDAVGFMIPVPYPGTVDWQQRMADADTRRAFEADPLSFTDRMHWRAKPLFPTLVEGARLEAAVREFWEELNPQEYVSVKTGGNVE